MPTLTPSVPRTICRLRRRRWAIRLVLAAAVALPIAGFGGW